MLQRIDNMFSRFLRWLFKPRFFVAKSELHVLSGRTRAGFWCTAPENATDTELRRIFATIDKPESEEVDVWFYSSLKDIGKRPYDVALLERSGIGCQPTITRPAGYGKEVTQA